MRSFIRNLTVVLLAVLLTVQCYAISRGEAYIEDNGYYDLEITDAAPGDTVYIALVKKSDDAADEADPHQIIHLSNNSF